MKMFEYWNIHAEQPSLNQFRSLFSSSFQDDAEFKKARGAELEYESLKVRVSSCSNQGTGK